MKVKFKVDPGFAATFRQAIKEEIGVRLRNNFGDFRRLIQEAIEEAVRDNRFSFIPTDEQAYELGVGEEGAGEINREKTEGAWKKLLPGQGYVSFSVRKSSGKKTQNVGTVVVSVDTEGFLEDPLSNVDKDSSEQPNPIPWMDWLINGAFLGEFTFVRANSQNAETMQRFSRTGGGIMVFGGTWDFAPAHPQAFEILNESIIAEVVNAIESNIGDVL